MRLSLLAIVVWLGLVGVAFAQEGGATDEDLDERARVHFHAGRDYYERGDYEGALREINLAWDMSHRPELLYNLGACHERLGHLGEAADFYEQYLAALPDVENHVAVAERVVRLRERAEAAAAEATDTHETTEGDTGDTTDPVDTVPPVVPPSSPGPHPASFVVLGVGAAGLVAFGILGGLALAEDDALANECGTACSPSRASTLEALGIGADVSLGVGASLAALGVVLLFTTQADAEAPAVAVGPGSVSVSGTF